MVARLATVIFILTCTLSALSSAAGAFWLYHATWLSLLPPAEYASYSAKQNPDYLIPVDDEKPTGSDPFSRWEIERLTANQKILKQQNSYTSECFVMAWIFLAIAAIMFSVGTALRYILAGYVFSKPAT